MTTILLVKTDDKTHMFSDKTRVVGHRKISNCVAKLIKRDGVMWGVAGPAAVNSYIANIAKDLTNEMCKTDMHIYLLKLYDELASMPSLAGSSWSILACNGRNTFHVSKNAGVIDIDIFRAYSIGVGSDIIESALDVTWYSSFGESFMSSDKEYHDDEVLTLVESYFVSTLKLTNSDGSMQKDSIERIKE